VTPNKEENLEFDLPWQVDIFIRCNKERGRENKKPLGIFPRGFEVTDNTKV
jgi:hypothetical protein